MLSKYCRVFVGLMLTVVLIGCGAGELPYTDNSKDSSRFALDIKQMILSSAEDIKKSPQPADSIRVIVQSLSELDACPTGDHLKTFQELHKLSSDLLAKSENGKPSDLPAKMKEIVDLANTLPGEVKIEKEVGKD